MKNEYKRPELNMELLSDADVMTASGEILGQTIEVDNDFNNAFSIFGQV